MSDKSDKVTLSTEALANAIAIGVKEAIKETRPTVDAITDEYVRREQEADPLRKLRRPVFHHGQPLQIKGCSDDTIKHLNELEPGEYINGKVQVYVRGRGADEKVYIDTPFRDKDERLRFYLTVSSFSDMVQKINREQKERKAARKDKE